jgi:hypothetical protein
MITKKNYIESYEEIQKQKEELRERETRVLSEFVRDYCPIKVGDIVTICGYGFTGKKGIVTRIKGEEAWLSGINRKTKLGYEIFGNVIKKDGTTGNQAFDFKEYHYELWLKNEKKLKCRKG